jgi:hypothetical protein
VGRRPWLNGPGGARITALLEARRPKVDAVVVLRLDRLGRDAAETLALGRGESSRRPKTLQVGTLQVGVAEVDALQAGVIEVGVKEVGAL